MLFIQTINGYNQETLTLKCIWCLCNVRDGPELCSGVVGVFWLVLVVGWLGFVLFCVGLFWLVGWRWFGWLFSANFTNIAKLL